MSLLGSRARTIWRLGLRNVVQVALYRLGILAGIHPAQRIKAPAPKGAFFAPVERELRPLAGNTSWQQSGRLFGHHSIPLEDGPPDWHQSPLDASRQALHSTSPWWRIADFAEGDIKNVWELSRFDWALAFAQQARCGRPGALERLNEWLSDWSAHNPPYLGYNWKCAQEASIRLTRLSLAGVFLEQDTTPSPAVVSFIRAHVARIEPTLSYASAQDNNHATSEAAALFIAGAWLSRAGQPEALALEKRGRALLERAVARLIATDGTFSQYSVTYHRLALDTLSAVEFWRRRAGLDRFTKRFYERAAAASTWLHALVDPLSGDAPNIGANDGANLLPLSDADYREFRIAVQLSSVLFKDANAYPPGPWDEALQWLGIDRAETALPRPESSNFAEGGFAVLRRNNAAAVLHFPRFRFRPSQADALHLDLWVEGQNVLRDGGSYSYNTSPELIEYFGGVESHNTVQFDGKPQMPRLSRFLLGDWLETERLEFASDRAAATYRSREGWRHRREVRLTTGLEVIDTIEGFTSEAILRWRLLPGEWKVDGRAVSNGAHRLTVSADVPVSDLVLHQRFESRYYGDKTLLPVVEVKTRHAGQLFSKLEW